MDTLYQDTLSYYGNGSSQRTRTLDALMPENVRIDDRKLSDLMAFAAKYARLINHYSAKNDISGSWESFFTTDISVILATIVSTNLDQLETRHQQLVAEISQTYQEMDKYGKMRELFEQILSVASQVDKWYRQVNRINLSRRGVEDTVSRELHNIIDRKLRALLKTLLAYDLGAGEAGALGGAIEMDYSQFDELWEIDLDVAEPINIYQGDTLNQKLDSALVQLRLLFRAFFNTQSYLVYHFDHYFEQSLSEKTNHKADISLFIGFLYLFRHAQKDLNQVAARHLAFYYDSYLLQKRREEVSDQVHACVKLAAHVNEHFLPAGTKLLAGREADGTEIVFETDRGLLVNQTKLQSLRTLYLSEFSKVETSRYQLITGMYAARVANSKDGKGSQFEGETPEWPTFGDEQQNRTEESRMMQEAEVGFVVASPMFFLQEGERVIRLHLDFVKESTSIYYKLIQALKQDRGIDVREAFNVAFPDGETKNLSVMISTENGWLEINPNDLFLRSPEPWTPYRITIEFTLSQADPAWVSYDPSLYEGEKKFPSRLPLLKLVLNHHVEPYGYSFLRDLEVETIDIEVSVDQVRKITAYNELGLLDTAQPFQPFGPLPTVGSYLLLGNAEVFRKPLTDLKIRYEWQNIPATDAEFDSRYEAYEEVEKGTDPIRAKDFKIGLSALSQNSFSPGEKESPLEHPLFEAEIDPEEYVEDDRVSIQKCIIKNIQLNKLKLVPEPSLENIPVFSNDARTGYLRLELLAPDPAFGHQLYQRLFPEIVTHNALPQNSGTAKDIPQQPYTPSLKSISFSYQAKTRINLANKGEKTIPEQVFHLHPFGMETIYFRGASRIQPVHLLPQYRENGYLMIGLTDLKPPENISLLFQLTTSKYKGSTRFRVPEVRWSYLANNQWIPFQREELLLDTTFDFTQKGLVQLAVPRGISTRNDIMPGGMYWIRAAVAGDIEVLCHATDVQIQAVSATWVNNGQEDRLSESLPKGSITKLVDAHASVQRIEQPFSSFGGKPLEGDREYFGRVSERLRTKGRAITHWDLERLTLGTFHTLKQVKCLSHLSHPDIESLSLEHGVTMVVIPSINDSPNPRTPKVNYKTLSDIEGYLEKAISPFAKTKVRNPVFEYLRVYASIKFTEGNNNGQTLKQLAQDLEFFLCPWMKDSTLDLQIGGSVSEDEVLNFIKALPYVVFVTKFSILQITRDEASGRYLLRDTAMETDRVSQLQAQPWGVLIPDDDHQFSLIEKEVEEEPVETPSPIHFQGMFDITRDGEHIQIKARLKPKVIGKTSSKKEHTLTIQL